MTWQYYEDVDKVNASGTGLALKCTYYRVEHRDGKEVLSTPGTGSLEAAVYCVYAPSFQPFYADKSKF